MYLFDKAKQAADKLHNTSTKELAENIRAKRQIAVQNKEYDFLSDYTRQAYGTSWHESRGRMIWYDT
ncbi:hypothetical protein [Chitinophaga sp. HK235]|uniref:hypothetical protein n=1 Tax=Chitinophaga sp. HK235 TaxID=2952571 RepID=UPI001BADFE2E|nr:hypothetical protein [Chitinophaga sp. HK235]